MCQLNTAFFVKIWSPDRWEILAIFFIYIWQSSLVKLAKKARLIVGLPKLTYLTVNSFKTDLWLFRPTHASRSAFRPLFSRWLSAPGTLWPRTSDERRLLRPRPCRSRSRCTEYPGPRRPSGTQPKMKNKYKWMLRLLIFCYWVSFKKWAIPASFRLFL